MATIKKIECACPRRVKATCAHKPYQVTYRGPGGREGKQLQESFKLKEKAEEFAIKVERDKDLGSFINPRQAKRLFSDIWREWVGIGDLEPGTLANYASVYKNHFEPAFGSRSIGSITTSEIVEWRQKQQEAGYKPYGIQVRGNLLSSIFGYAVGAEIIGRNPCKTANPRKTSGKSAYVPVRDEEIPSAEEVLGIIAETPKILRASLWGMAGSGLRPGESLAICNQSIDWQSQVTTVNHQISAHGLCEITGSRRGIKRGTKHRAFEDARETPCPQSVIDVYDEHISSFGTWGEEGWLFESPKFAGRHPSYDWLLREFNKAAERAGCGQYQPKSLRHFFVSQALHAKIPLFEIAQWVGHRDTRTTETVYGHLVRGATSKGAHAMEARLRGDLTALKGTIQARALSLVPAVDDEGEEAA